MKHSGTQHIMRLFRHALTACAILLPVFCAAAQDNIYEVSEEMKESDFQPRVDVGFEIPLAEDFSFTINNELRFRDNSKRIDRTSALMPDIFSSQY